MSSYDKTFKILFLSDPEVDKSVMFSGYLTYSPQPDDHNTIGIEFHIKTLVIEKKKYKIQLWDLTEMERFRFLLPTYCLGANAAVLLYDVTRSQTLDNIGGWANIVRQKGGDIPIMLVGIIPNEKKERQVSTEQGKEIAKIKNLNGFIVTRLMVANKGYNFVIAKKRDDRFSLKSKERTKISSPKIPSKPPLSPPPPPPPKPLGAPTIPAQRPRSPVSLRGAIMEELKHLFSKSNKDAQENICDLKTKKVKEFTNSNLPIPSRSELLQEISRNIIEQNRIIKEHGIDRENYYDTESPDKENSSINLLIDNLILNIQKNPSKKVLYLRLFLERFRDISDEDKNMIIQSLMDEESKKKSDEDDDDDDRYPYPYIFKPPNPPDDFEMAPQLLIRPTLKNKDPEEEIYCQYCGIKLTKEEQLTHSCKNKPKNK